MSPIVDLAPAPERDTPAAAPALTADPLTPEHAPLVRLLQTHYEQMDRSLPPWARRSNPVVRRHLGAYWKAILPDLRQMTRWMLIQSTLVLVALPLPWLLTLLMPAVTVSIFLLPIVGVIYGVSLFHIGAMAAESVASERRNDTLTVLRATPQPLLHILGSKMAAAVWRQIEDLNIVLIAAALLSAPVLIVEYGVLYAADENPWLTIIGVIVGLFACTLRLLLEPILVGALGIVIGATTPTLRMSAGTLTALTSAAYFALLNLPRLLPLEFLPRLLLESVAPLALPIALAWLALRVAAWALARD
jgi:hypothetical protein